MAVGIRDKRFSMLGLGLDSLRVRPNPDGSLALAADRLHFLPLYRGFADPTFPDPYYPIRASASDSTRLAAASTADALRSRTADSDSHRTQAAATDSQRSRAASPADIIPGRASQCS